MPFYASAATGGYALREAATGVRVSYGELAQRTAELGQSLSLGRTGLAVSFFRNDLISVENYLACLEGNVAVFLADPGIDPVLQTRLVATYQPEWVLSSRAEDGAHLPSGDYRMERSEGGRWWWRRLMDNPAPVHQDLALLLTTSGSTGSSKLVRLTLGSVAANAASIASALGLTAEERPITTLPLHYSYGLSVLNSHLVAGAEIVLTEERILSREFWDHFRANQCTSWAGVPYSYEVLRRLDLRNINAPSLRHLTQAGGKMHPDAIRNLHSVASSKGVQLWVMYGQTEATARISVLPSRDLPERIGSVGQAIPGGSIWAENDGQRLPAGEVGELFYAGPNVMLGYATRREDLAAGDGNKGVLATGDLGYIDSEGYCYITGRSKRIAKVMGIRLNLDEIEQMVRARAMAAVLGGEDRLLIVMEENHQPAVPVIQKELAEQLHLHPSCFVFRTVDRLPLTGNGKIDYPALQESM